MNEPQSAPTIVALEPTEDLYTTVEVPKSSAALATTARRRREWGRHALVAGVSLGALGGFLAVTRTLRSARASKIDRAIMERTARFRTRRLNGAVRDVTSLGGVTIATMTATTAMLVARRSPVSALQIALGCVGGVIAEVGIKHYFARPRPDFVEKLQDVHSYSYPSGHAIASSCLFLTLGFVGGRRLDGRHARAALLGATGTLAALVGATRVYLGVHYPTDVLGGLALGTAWASLIEAGFDFAGARALEERRRRRHDGSVRANFHDGMA